jgi:uncharacterized protein
MDHLYALFEVKSDPNDDTGLIRGYGSCFGNVDSYGDTVAKGAFAASISDINSGAVNYPPMLAQHGTNSQMPIGVWDSIEEDNRGLKLRGRLALNTAKGLEIYNLLKMKPRPALNGLSIGYVAKDFELHRTGPVKRTLKAVDLKEISVVTFPADKYARVASVKRWLETPVVDEAALAKAWAMAGFEEMRRLMNHRPR